MIEFGLLVGKNFLSYGSGGFEYDISSARNTLIRGKSGHGKSAILEALCYCLFGRPYRDLKLAQLINSKNKKDLYTEVNFRSGPDSFKVIRRMKPNEFLIYKNEELIEQEGSVADYQKKLETILGFNFAIFKQVCVIGSIEYTQFMKLDAAKRRAMIDELLDIKVFTLMSAIAKEALSTLNRSFETISDKTAQKDTEIQRLRNILNTMEQNEKDKEGTLRQELETALEDLKSKMDIAEKISVKIEKLTGKTEGIADLKRSNNQIRDIMSDLSADSREKSQIVQFFEENPDSCPTCLQHIEEDHKNSLIEKANKKISNNKKKIDIASEQMDSVKEQIAQIEEIFEKISELNHMNVQITSDIRNLNYRISSINESLNKKTDSDLIKTQIDASQAERIALDDSRHVIEVELKYAKECVNILKDTGIKAKIVKIYIPIINQYINRYLEELDLFVQFELDENFDEKILSRHRDGFSYNSFSNGEQQRIDLAILFTWREIAKRKNSVSTNILIFDETVDKSLDDGTIECFIAAIESLNANCVIISHRDMQTAYFDRILHVVKNSDDYSVIHDIS